MGMEDMTLMLKRMEGAASLLQHEVEAMTRMLKRVERVASFLYHEAHRNGEAVTLPADSMFDPVEISEEHGVITVTSRKTEDDN
jgi:hypothetical protein